MSDRALRLLAALVALAGAALAGYLAWAHYEGDGLVCPVGGGCETIQESEYAEIGGIPVAVLGLAAYALILTLLAWDTQAGRLAAAAVSLTGLLFSGYLLVLQLFVIDALCFWCVVNDVVIAPALALLTGLRLRSWEPDGGPSARHGRGSPPGSRRCR